MKRERPLDENPVPAALDVARLVEAYRSGTLSPAAVIRDVYARVARHAGNPVWISLVPEAEALARAAALESDPRARTLPLYGVPFAVKDNIDVAGMPTTAACPAAAYVPGESATAVRRLLDAGAILVGKTNLDQFATGLVGVRSPYGAVRNAFDPAYVSGGSSSGSAVAVAAGMVGFALGTDTAGSGRVPAAFNNIVGLKPTRGLVSTLGVVPACRSLDCVSVFALTSDDARAVLDVLDAPDAGDDFSRADRVPRPAPAQPLRVGVPSRAMLEFFGDRDAERLFREAVARAQAMGHAIVEVDLAPFLEAAALLYGGPWVAERYAAVRDWIEKQPDALLPVTRAVIGAARGFSATDVFEAMYRLAALKRRTAGAWERIDVLLLPTAGTIYTLAELDADPIGPNSNLGRYTNFVNLLDLSAIALPAGFREDGLPFGITFVAPALHDRFLCRLGRQWQEALALPLGATGEMPSPVAPAKADVAEPGTVHLAVVGAHLTGQPLNRELVERGAQLVRACRTASAYRLYALANTQPAKPGLVRDASGGAIEVEVWAMPTERFGSFVAGIPAPLGIGTLELEDGSFVKGFICEAHAIAGARDISEFGGWRAYLARRAS